MLPQLAYVLGVILLIILLTIPKKNKIERIKQEAREIAESGNFMVGNRYDRDETWKPDGTLKKISLRLISTSRMMKDLNLIFNENHPSFSITTTLVKGDVVKFIYHDNLKSGLSPKNISSYFYIKKVEAD